MKVKEFVTNIGEALGMLICGAVAAITSPIWGPVALAKLIWDKWDTQIPKYPLGLVINTSSGLKTIIARRWAKYDEKWIYRLSDSESYWNSEDKISDIIADHGTAGHN